MEQLLPYSLLLAAIGCGWLLGRRSLKGGAGAESAADDSYYRGLRFLLSEQPSNGVDEFIQAVPVNEHSLNTHLSLAQLMRSKGELEAATRIHQNLLARPSLSRDSLHQVLLELARDYISAGLHDRAERLLRDLAGESSAQESEALRYLQQIYQAEKDWGKAAAVAKRRIPKRSWLRKARAEQDGGAISCALSHYYCEMAEQHLSEANEAAARRCLQKARQSDGNNVRVVLMLASLSLRDQPEYSLNLLHRIAESQPAFVPEVLPLFREAFMRLPEAASYLAALRPLASATDSSAVHIEVAEQMDDHELACGYLREVLNKRATLKLMLAALSRQLYADVHARPLVQSLQALCAEQPSYCCRHCGFSGRKLHWLCPSCEQWGTIAPIRGIQGD